MIRKLGSVIIALAVMLLSGCGDDSSDNQTPQTIQGVVIGSHYEGAWVCVDFDSNGVCDGETITVTDANGAWTLDDPGDSELNVVAEIYVDNIKHSDYPSPPSSTLVENPMVFVAPLKGEEDNQLIVSPISTMVHKSMQEFDLPFEAAKESVAKEVGVSSNILLTNYNVKNPSPDQLILLERSAVEIEKLGVTMTYHDNYVKFDINGPLFIDGSYKVEDFYIPSAQDPHHWIKIGTVVDLDWVNKYTTSLDFVLGRHGSSSAADWWKNRVHASQNNYNKDPGKLNFALRGTFTVNYKPSQFEENVTYVFSDFFIGQGFTGDHNNWWIGGPGCRHQYEGSVICDCKNKYGKATKISFYGDPEIARTFLISHE
jgi:hypothetical protein